MGTTEFMIAGLLTEAAGSALAGVTLSTLWGLVGPATLGAVLTGSALLPIGLLAATTTRQTNGAERDKALPGMDL